MRSRQGVPCVHAPLQSARSVSLDLCRRSAPALVGCLSPSRIVRAFLVEEQKVVKKVIKAQGAAAKLAA